MNVFDFDNTLYDGESCFDFFFFCLKDDGKLKGFVPMIVFDLLLYKLGIIHADRLTADAEKLCRHMAERGHLKPEKADAFWSTHAHKLKPELCRLVRPGDIILTASPQSLIERVADRLNTQSIIGSQVDLETGKVDFLCFRESKILRLKEMMDGRIESVYTDSVNDRPLMALAEQAYLVKGKRVRKITP